MGRFFFDFSAFSASCFFAALTVLAPNSLFASPSEVSSPAFFFLLTGNTPHAY